MNIADPDDNEPIDVEEVELPAHGDWERRTETPGPPVPPSVPPVPPVPPVQPVPPTTPPVGGTGAVRTYGPPPGYLSRPAPPPPTGMRGPQAPHRQYPTAPQGGQHHAPEWRGAYPHGSGAPQFGAPPPPWRGTPEPAPDFRKMFRTPRQRARRAAVIGAAILGVVAFVGTAIGIAHTSTPPRPAPPTVTPSALPSLALTSGEVLPGSTAQDFDSISEPVVVPQECATVWAPTTTSLPLNSETGVFVRKLLSPDPRGPQLIETLVSLRTADDAVAARDDIIARWRSCSGKTLFVGEDSQASQLLAGPVVGTDPASTSWDVSWSQGWGCERAVSAWSNLLVDVSSCGKTSERAARQAVSDILAQAPKTLGSRRAG